jgi:hypothetical protein
VLPAGAAHHANGKFEQEKHMANRFLGEGAVTVDGKMWTLRFDMNVLGNLERQLGKPAMTILAEMDNGATPIDTRRMICHEMLKKHQPNAKIEDAGEILSVAPDAFFAVLQAAMPDKEGGEAGKGQAEAGQGL